MVQTKRFTIYALKYFFRELSGNQLAMYVHLRNHATIIYHVRTIDTQLEIEQRQVNKPFTITWENLKDRIIRAAREKELERAIHIQHQALIIA
jgi:hypothetical protein